MYEILVLHGIDVLEDGTVHKKYDLLVLASSLDLEME